MKDIRITPIDKASQALCERRWDAIAKPLKSLGELEEIISRLAGIRKSADIPALKKCVLVFCADNGVVKEGVTQTDSSVIAAVAKSIAEGTANVNAMARVAGAEVFGVDMGMLRGVEHPALIDRRVAAGTGNIAEGPAMTGGEALRALKAGRELVLDRTALNTTRRPKTISARWRKSNEPRRPTRT